MLFRIIAVRSYRCTVISSQEHTEHGVWLPEKKSHTNIFPEWSDGARCACAKCGGRYYNNNSLLDGFYYITLVVASTRRTDVRRHACGWMVELDV